MANNKTHDFPKYICYLSNSKVENLYSQIATMDVSKIQTQKEMELDGKAQIEPPTIMQIIKSGLSFGMRRRTLRNEEGQLNYIQKFREIVSFCYKNWLIANINEMDKWIGDNTPILYTLTGKFTCDAFHNCDKDFLNAEKAEADNFKHSKDSVKTIGRIVVLKTNIGDRKLYLACSTKFFSDMGGTLRDAESSNTNEDCYVIRPHSGNHFFFSGTIDATFEAIFILNGQKDDCLFGSPVALINDFSSELII